MSELTSTRQILAPSTGAAVSQHSIGVIFDWDGVIIDSSAAHRISWERLASEIGKLLPDDHFERGFGRKNTVIIPDILGWTDRAKEIARLSDRKEEIYREVLREGTIEPVEGVRPLLEALQSEGIPCAIGSSTARANIDLALEAMELTEFFAAIVAAEDVTRSKPDPQVFLKAAELIQRAPARCIVFEDAPFGIDAAHAGGMRAIGVRSSTNPRDIDHADRMVDRLDELTPKDLQDLVFSTT